MNLTNFYKEELKDLYRVINLSFKNRNRKKDLFFLLKAQRKAIKTRKTMSKKHNISIPLMLLISVTERCNLKCRGCYSASIKDNKEHSASEMSLSDYKRIFDESNDLGISIITLVGGEPLLRKDLIKLATKYKRILFPVYTNGMLMDKHIKDIFLNNANLIPFFSIEGFKHETEQRRGFGVYDLLIEKMNFMKENHLFYAVSITVARNNYQSVTSKEFLDFLNDSGCSYVSYVEFEALTEDDLENTLTKEIRTYHNNRVRELAKQYKNIFFISYPDFEYKSGGCMAAGRGFFHLNAYGDVEPCNFIPLSDINIKTNSIVDCLKSPLFHDIKINNLLDDIHDGECALLAKQTHLQEIIIQKKSLDT